MFGAIKEKLHGVQKDFSLKFLSTKKSGTSDTKNQRSLQHPDAGSEILYSYQTQWQLLHQSNESNIAASQAAGKELELLHTVIERRSSSFLVFTKQLYSVNAISDQLNTLVTEVASLEGLCEEVEMALAYLEVLCLTQEFQEKRLEQKFQLALYREKKMAQLKETTSAMESEYVAKASQKAKTVEVERSEKVKFLQGVFEADLNYYKTTGKIRNSLVGDGDIYIPHVSEPEVAVAEHTVACTEEELGDTSALEEFLDENKSAGSASFVTSPLPDVVTAATTVSLSTVGADEDNQICREQVENSD